jgi:hypothetical protein
MNEQYFARHIKERLDDSLEPGPAAAERLRAARERALARHRGPGAARLVMGGGAAALGGGSHGSLHVLTRIILPAAIVLAALFGFNEWQQQQREALLSVDPATAEAADEDASVLKSDLPLDAYLDKGFRAWLQSPLDDSENTPSQASSGEPAEATSAGESSPAQQQ